MHDPKKDAKSTFGQVPRHDPWLPLLGTLSLSRTEKEVVRRYEADPSGRAFLPVADILRAHRLLDESLELLAQGVERHPGFTVARVVLARELLQKGLVAEAWRVLEDSPVSLRDNLLAQKLRFRLSLLLGQVGPVKSIYQHLLLQQMLDSDTKRLGDALELEGLEPARDKLINDLRERGIEVVIPTEPMLPQAPSAVSGSAGVSDKPAPVLPPITAHFETENDHTELARLAAFHVVPLAEIFRAGESGVGLSAPSQTGMGGGIELDSTTLADIYARQGHYSKALAVYRRLLRLTPNHDLLRRKLAELSKLEREQRDVDLTIDPALVDRMEAVEIIDRQMRFYNELLSRLS